MAKSNQKVRMPAGIQSKLMSATAMLLVGAVMLVSSTYAWFTLSTAPEVTGISTSVGANGNLEMALLTTDSYADTSKITSAVGDSSEATSKDATTANITWGNLVDLSDITYGLNNISLLPSRLVLSTTDSGTTYTTSLTSPLKTAVYGSDGRVKDVTGATYSAVYASSTWAYNSTSQTYGVRAIGANDNLTAQQAGLLAAKANYKSLLLQAQATAQSTLSANGQGLANAIIALAKNTEDISSYENDIQALITGVADALNKVDEAYTQVSLAYATTLDTAAYNAARTAIEAAQNFDEALSVMSENGITVPQELTDTKNALTEKKTAVGNAQSELDNDQYKQALKELVDYEKVTVNGCYAQYDETGAAAGTKYVTDAEGNISSEFANSAYKNGGVIVELLEDSGIFAYIGQVAGNYSATTSISVSYGSMNLEDLNTVIKTNVTVSSKVTDKLNSVVASGASAETTALSDLYGYAVDLAFRTNAAGSSLQLQSDAAQRVYSDSTNTATQGNGSTMTFKSVTGANLSDTQVSSLMSAIRVAFVGDDNTVYGIASLDSISADGDNGMTGTLTLKDYSVGADGVLKLTTAKSEATLVALQQNQVAKVTVVVWLDGDYVDNTMVTNFTSSITGSLNLQFSSSADLVPMENTALKNGNA